MILTNSTGALGSGPYLYTGTGNAELNRYLWLINSPDSQSASGLKVGGVLISDSYAFANPGKNDLVVKGNIGIGKALPDAKLHISKGPSWTSANWGKSLKLDNMSAIEFDATENGTGDRFGIGGTTSGRAMYFFTTDANNENLNYRMILSHNGNIGMGAGPDDMHKLLVNGTIKAKEVKVTLSGWSDYVFDDEYRLKSLQEVEKYIQDNKHLPDVPSALEVEKEGVNIGEMEAILLKKIEELTLYMIELKKENQILQTSQTTLQNQINQLQKSATH
jgi:predicted DNA-binding protein (UPF0251 family)